MKPLHHPLVPDGRGRRTPQTLLRRDKRDRYLIEAAQQHFRGLSQREAARQIRSALMRYRDGRWRRDRSELTCPVQHHGKLVQTMWRVLKVRDAIPSDRTIRAVLARSDPPTKSSAAAWPSSA